LGEAWLGSSTANGYGIADTPRPRYVGYGIPMLRSSTALRLLLARFVAAQLVRLVAALLARLVAVLLARFRSPGTSSAFNLTCVCVCVCARALVCVRVRTHVCDDARVHMFVHVGVYACKKGRDEGGTSAGRNDRGFSRVHTMNEQSASCTLCHREASLDSMPSVPSLYTPCHLCRHKDLVQM